MKLASCKSALNPPVVCSTDRSKALQVRTYITSSDFQSKSELCTTENCL